MRSKNPAEIGSQSGEKKKKITRTSMRDKRGWEWPQGRFDSKKKKGGIPRKKLHLKTIRHSQGRGAKRI